MAQPRTAGFATGVALLLPISLSTMAVLLLAPILPMLLHQFSAVPGHEYWVPMILTVPALCVAIISPVAGVFGDKFGRRRLLIIALFVYGLVGLAPLLLSSLPAILFSRLGVGISEALISTLSTTMIADYFEGEQRNKWLAGQTAVASLSAILFFNIGGQLGGLGWRAPFWIYGSAFGMLLGVLMYTWKQGPAGEHLVAEQQTLGTAKWSDFPWRRMGVVLGVTVFVSVLFYTVQVQSGPGLFEHGMTSPARIGFFSSLASIGTPIGTIIYSRISRTPVFKLLTLEFLLLGIGFVVMSAAATQSGYLVGCAINQVAAGLILPTILVWAMDRLRFDLRARGTGLWTAAFSLGQWLSPIATTTIGFHVGGLLPSFQYLGYAAWVAAACAILYWCLRNRTEVASDLSST